MFRFLIIFLFLPWWGYFPLAGAVGYYAQMAFQREAALEEARLTALTVSPPDPVDLTWFNPNSDVHMADEVNVTGWVHPDLLISLEKKSYQLWTTERTLYPLFGESDAAGATKVRAAVLLNPADEGRFESYLAERAVIDPEGREVIDLNGLKAPVRGLSQAGENALIALGYDIDPDFFYVEPFLDGRDAALGQDGVPEKERMQILIVALVVALFGVVKWISPKLKAGDTGPSGNAARINPRAPGGANKAMNYDYAFAARKREVALSSAIDPDSPLGRLAQRTAGPITLHEAGGQQTANVHPPVEQQSDEQPDHTLERALMAHDALRSFVARGPRRLISVLVLAAGGAFAAFRVLPAETAALLLIAGASLGTFVMVGAIIRLARLSRELRRSATAAGLSRRQVAERAREARQEAPASVAEATPRNPIDSLRGSRAWVRAEAKGDPAPGAIQANPRKQLRSDPFAKLAVEAKSTR